MVETGEILDIHHDELQLKDDALIGLVHPLQLTNEQTLQLRQSLKDDEITQPFPQIERPIYQLTPTEKQEQTITRFRYDRFATGSLIGFRNKGWKTVQVDEGICQGYKKTINGHELSFSFDDGYVVWEGVPENDKGQQLAPIKLPDGMSDIDISEFIYVLDNMVRLG